MQPWWRGQAVRGVGVVLALALLALAVWMAGREVDPAALRGAAPSDLVMLAALVAANLLATAGVYWLVTLTFDARPRVGYGVTLELISASALLNYIPGVRPGLWGRAAYLKVKHGLPVTQSMMILGCVFALAVAAATATLVLLLPMEVPGTVRWGILLGALAVMSAATPIVARLVLRRSTVAGWLWLPIRTLDLLAAGGRLWVAFRILGQPIGFDAAVLAGAAGLLVKLAGVTPNGLGMSEWVVAGLAGALEPVSAATGAAAALVDRAVEVVVVVIAGLAGVIRVRSRLATRVRSALDAKPQASLGEVK